MKGFIDYLHTIYVGGLVDSCKIDCKKRNDSESFLDCEAIDVESTMKLESSLMSEIKGFKQNSSIAIYDLALLINMLSYSEEDKEKEDSGEIWVDESKLYYDGRDKKVEYSLADPELIDKVDLGKTIADFLEDETIGFSLNATQMREIIKGLNIIPTDFIKIYTKKNYVMAEIGELNKFVIKVEKFEWLTENKEDISVCLDSKNLTAVLRTALMVKGNIKFFIKDSFPAVVKLENMQRKPEINTAYLISPIRIEKK